MHLFPAIDLLEGRAVRLHKGRYDEVTVYHDDPAALAASWRGVSARLHVVDLMGAKLGRPVEADLIKRIAAAFGPGMQVGGGVRDRAALDGYFALGVERVVMGTAAIRDPAFVREAAGAYPGRVVIAVDAKDGMVATDGWLTVSSRPAVDVVRELADVPLGAVLYTDIARDGTRVGPNIDATAALARDGGLPVIASGGVSSLDDLRALSRHAGIVGAIVGKALYEKVFTLEEAIRASAAE
jgi:phosphoribosylformimino-5-aminoimidazole carboxamide ribotide isomerase